LRVAGVRDRVAAMSVAPQGRDFAAARVARNGALTASADVLSKIFSLVFFALIARRLGEAVLGYYVFAQALTSLIWSFAGFGLDRMALRDIARDPALMTRVVVPMATIKLIAAGVLTAVAAGLLAVTGRPAEVVWLVVLLGFATAVGLAVATLQMVFAANERMEHVFVTRVPWSLATAAVGAGVVAAGGGLVLAVFCSSGVLSLAGAAWTWALLVRRYGRPHVRLQIRSWPGLLKRALPFGLQEMLGQVIFRFDTVVLALLVSSAMVGAYGAAYRMLEATLFIAWSLGFAVMPMYSYLESRTQERSLELIYEGSLKAVLAVMAPIATVFVICAPALIDLVYGLPRYEASVGLLRILAPAIAVYGLGHLAGLLVLARSPGRVTVAATGVVAVFNVLACLVLIPLAGATGAAVATLASESLLAVIALVLAARAIGWPRLGWTLATPLLASAAMAAICWPLRDELWLALPAAAIAYGVVLLALEAPRLREDFAIFRSIVANRPVAGEPFVGP
jgi:O-antigen/teichoic acid export membrane protein